MKLLKPISTQIDPSLYAAIVDAREAGKIPKLREFIARALYDALPPPLRKGVAKP